AAMANRYEEWAEVHDVVAELIEASHEYFTGYCVDEADDDCATGSGFDTGCTREQHEAAKRLREALARVHGGALWPTASPSTSCTPRSRPTCCGRFAR